MKKSKDLMSFGETKGRRTMTALPEPMPIPADFVPGPKQGEWTYSQYAALPDDGERYEIIDGVLYLMPPSPKEWHQQAVVLLTIYLGNHVQLAGLGRVYVAPFDVELAFNTVVQPDILVILQENMDRITPSRVVGAPDLAVEVLSPGTARYDRLKKSWAYAQAGVREYWLVDPLKKTIEVFALEGGEYSLVGVFSGEERLHSAVVVDFPVKVGQIFA